MKNKKRKKKRVSTGKRTENIPTLASNAASPDASSTKKDVKPSHKDAAKSWRGKQKILPSVVAEVRRLYLVEHWKVNTIANALGIHRDTVSRALGSFLPRQEEELDVKSASNLGPPNPHALDEFYEFIERTLREHPSLTTTRLTDMLKERGFEKTHYVVRRYIKKHNLRPQPRKIAFLRLNPMKGEQAQVDWAQVGELNVTGGKRKLWLFIMTLSWSRASWGELVFDLTADSLQRSLARAAEYFGGNTRQWLFDNPRTIVTARHGDAVQFHPLLVETASHFLVSPRLCNPYSPQEKGRVERTIRYWRDRFFAGRFVRSIESGNEELLDFIESIANKRPHPTFKERKVEDLFEEERVALIALPEHKLDTDVVKPAKVDKTAFIRFDRNEYSTPPQYVRETLLVVANDKRVKIVRDGKCVAEHKRCWGKRQIIELPRHREELLKRKKSGRDLKGRDRLRFHVEDIDRLYERWAEKGRSMGSMTARTGKALDEYGPEIFKKAIARILKEGTHDPSRIRVICEEIRYSIGEKPTQTPTFGAHVAERDVVPHDLGGYDV